MDIDRALFSRIKEVLKVNPRGMNVTEIAREIGMNRLSVAKYLEILVVSGHIDVKAFGPAKVYYISNRLPISAMLSLSSDFIIILDKDLNIIHMNDQFLSFSGIRREDILYKKIENFSFPLEFSPSIMPNVVEALNGKELVAEAYLKRNGKQLYFNIKFIPLVLDDGQKGVTVLFENITDRKRIEIAIEESEQKLRSVIEQSMDSIVITDERGVIVEFNHGAEGITGIERIKAIGQNIWDFQSSMSTHDRNDQAYYEVAKSAVQGFLKSGKSPQANKYVENEIRRPDGSLRTIQSITFPIKTEKGYMLCGITRDITDRKRAERELKESEGRFRAIFEQAAVGIAYVGDDDRILTTNRRFCDILEYPYEGITGLTYKDITYPEDISVSERYLGQLKSGSVKSYSYEKRYVRKDGSLVWANVTVSLLRLSGYENYHIVVIEDITERKTLESRLRLAGFALDNAADLIGLIKLDSSIYYVNDSICKSLGYTREELLHMSAMDVDTSFTKERWVKGMSLVKAEGYVAHFESGYKAKDGSIIPVEIVGRYIEFNGEGFICVNARDIAEHIRIEKALRKSHDELEQRVRERTLELDAANKALRDEILQKTRAEEALRESEANLKKAQEIACLGFWMMDVKNNTCQWSDGNYQILGYQVGECTPCMESWIARVHPDDRDIVLEKIKNANDNVPHGNDYRIVHPDGSIHYMHDETSPSINDESGNPVKLFGTIQDVTELRLAETALHEKQAKLEAQAEELRINNDKLEKEILDRKMAEEALQASEMRFRSLIQNSSDIIRILDKGGLIVFDSPSSEKILGYPPGYTLGKSPLDFIHPDDIEKVRRDLGDVYCGKNTGVPTEFRIRKANGEYLDAESIAANMMNVPGVHGIVITTRSVAERKKATEALRMSENKYRNLIENISDCVWETDKNLVFTYMNSRSYDMSGYKPEEILGKTPYDLMGPEEAKLVKSLLSKVALEKLPFSLLECKVFHKDGHAILVEIGGEPIFDANGAFSGFRGITRDVTRRIADNKDISRYLSENRRIRGVSPGMGRHDL
jgi:PAS domain S-box-containing protein